MTIITVLFLVVPLAFAGAIVSNIPVIVTENKNYTSSNPTWLTSSYFRAGYEEVIKVFTGSNVPSTDYTFTFSSALPGIPNLAYGIKQYRGNDYLGQEFYEIKKTALTASTFSVSIQIFGVTNLWMLTVAYLAVDPTFPHHLNSFDNVPINATGGNIVNISTQSLTLQYYTQYINYTDQTAGRPFRQFTNPLSSNKIVLFMSSLWIRGTFGTYVHFHVYTEVINESFYMWNATLEKSVLVTNVHFSQVIFNSDDVQSSQKYFIVYNLWYNDANGGFLPIPQQFVDNFIMGVTTFECSSAACGFEYQWIYTNKTINGVDQFGVEILLSWTLTNTCGFSWSETSIFYMMTWQCVAPYYYFNLTSGLCQTLCGGYNIEDQQNYVCMPCQNTLCYQCDNPTTNLCSDCAAYLHYELVNGKCVCMSGYLRSSSTCSLCWNANTGCYNCSYDDGAGGTLPYNASKFVCLSCNQTENYFMSGTRCSKCTLSNCPDCLNLTACEVCSVGYNFSELLTCIVCNVVGCVHCALTNPNVCVLCNSTLGYYADSSTQKCKTLCGDGIYVSAKEGCDDGNLADFDGCSASCTVEPSFSCQGSPSACSFADAVTLSVESQHMEENICNTITFGFRFTPPSETFAQPYVEWDNFLSSPNQSLLIPNHSMSVYSAGVLSVSYFLMGHLQNRTLIFDVNFSVLLPNSSILLGTSAPSLDFIVSTTPEALMFCCPGFFMNEQEVRCDEICGDGILFYLSCDDGNLKSGDGCSSTCTIEPDYVCMNGSTSSPSICSYNGTFSVALQTGDKSPSSNSLTLTYTIEPSAPMLSLNNGSTNFLSMVSFPSSPGVIVTSATLDPVTNELVITVDYSESLQNQPLSLQLTPPDVPQAVLVPKLSSSWIVKPTNQLAAVVYSEEDYATVAKLTPLADGLVGSYLTVVVLTLVFRKYIGLELAALYQIGFLSLLQNSEVSTYSQPISGWDYVFGYNGYYLSPPPKERFSSPYTLYGYQKYFGFSNNAMVLAAGSVFGVAALLLVVSMLTSKSASRKIKTASSLVAGEVGYALVVFSTPNIVTAFCIEAHEGVLFEAEYVWSKAFLVGSLGLLIASHLLNLSNAQESTDVGTFLRKHSKLGIYMPVALSLRTAAITALLFTYHITQDVPQYFIVLVQTSYVLFIVFGRPHKKLFDFVRSLCLEVGLLYNLIVRFVDVKILSEYAREDSTLFAALAYTEYSIYGLGSTLSTISLIYHVAKAIKGKKVQPEREEREALNKDVESPEVRGSNESLSKVEPSPSKRRLDENPLIFDIEQAEVAQIPNTSVMSFDTKINSRKIRTRKSKNK